MDPAIILSIVIWVHDKGLLVGEEHDAVLRGGLKVVEESGSAGHMLSGVHF